VNTATALVLVAGIGGAVYLYTRSQAQQQQAIAAAAAAAPPPAAGGITGFAGGLWTQFKGDPLGIKNAKAVVNFGANTTRSAAGEVSSLVGSIKGIF
jgi:hypothetical protein